MDRETIKTGVYQVISKVLGIDTNEVSEDQSFTADLGAESVQSVELMAGFEEEFEIEMDEDEALAVQTVGGAIDFIAQYVND
ncbi:MAG: phosphopantetheine-binding protein [Gemmatimonadetes bacterium]|nr:phosphopantetheine-binding protein [Gemmatimonadota bacterium]